MNTICLLVYGCLTNVEDVPVSLCLGWKVFQCVLKSETGISSGLLKVSLLVRGELQNQRSLQS